jgi:hypothetical protein
MGPSIIYLEAKAHTTLGASATIEGSAKRSIRKHFAIVDRGSSVAKQKAISGGKELMLEPCN